INGELDLQVPHEANLQGIEQALRDGGNGDVTVRSFPGLNHLFQTATTGLPTEYAS
ncbi:MAG: alpha/beta hydrolase, partial [Akkermansiaceae bacterium]|nr:alpha/beta hydrolase [Akkermansiaceae bacterium]NIV60487.1 alpha/beta hydrolase [Gemmatimonadota bacterium]